MSSNKILERIEKTKEKVKQFSELLDSIDSLEDKKKSLWKEIYEILFGRPTHRLRGRVCD